MPTRPTLLSLCWPSASVNPNSSRQEPCKSKQWALVERSSDKRTTRLERSEAGKLCPPKNSPWFARVRGPCKEEGGRKGREGLTQAFVVFWNLSHPFGERNERISGDGTMVWSMLLREGHRRESCWFSFLFVEGGAWLLLLLPTYELSHKLLLGCFLPFLPPCFQHTSCAPLSFVLSYVHRWMGCCKLLLVQFLLHFWTMVDKCSGGRFHLDVFGLIGIRHKSYSKKRGVPWGRLMVGSIKRV